MKEIFFQILDMSVNASLLVLVVIGVRLVLKKAPKYIHCTLWAMVALRLICPALPESEASLMPSNTPVSSMVHVETQSKPVTNELPLATLPQIPIEQMEEQEPQIQWMDILCVVWLVGVATMAGYGAISYLLLRRRVVPSVQQDGVWLCDDVASPFILGVIRPRIYLPSSLDEDCRKSVLAHEKAHLRRKDHWWKPLGFVLLTIHWFNPIMWLAYILLCRDIEAACDERVVKGMEPEERKRYSEALLECAMPRRSIAACPLAFGEQGIKGRIKSVLNYKKPTIWIILATVVALSVVSVCFLTNPNQTLLAYVDVYDNPVMSTGRVPEGSYTRYTLTGYEEELEAFEDAMSKKKKWKDLTKYDWATRITYSITILSSNKEETYYMDANETYVFKEKGGRLWFDELTNEEKTLFSSFKESTAEEKIHSNDSTSYFEVADYNAPADPKKYNSSQREVLKAMVPQYFGVADTKGVEIYVWDEEGMLWCGLMPGTNRHKSQAEIDGLDGVPLPSMALILDTYEDIDDVALYVLGESEYWGKESQYVYDGSLELWLKGQLGLLDVSIEQDISTGEKLMRIGMGAKVLTYKSTGENASGYQTGFCLTDDAVFDRGFEPSGLSRWFEVGVYTIKGGGNTRLIILSEIYELIITATYP